MNGSLSCPRCGATGIALGAAGCPACGVGFAAPVVAPVASMTTATAQPYQFVPDPVATTLAAPTATYATFGQRCLSGLIDALVIMMPFTLLFGWSGSSEDVFSLDAEGIAEIVGSWIYYAAMQSSAWQATLGMRALRLRVVHEDDYQPISFLRATARNFASYVSAAILMIGYIMIAFTGKRQALHDIMTSTVVVRDEQSGF